jgi:hypothetical protein
MVIEDRADRRRQIRTLGFAQRRRPIRASDTRVDSSIGGFRAPAGRRRGALPRGCLRWLSGAQPKSDKGKIRAARKLF